jgi:xanthine dehydrogenase small subunit
MPEDKHQIRFLLGFQPVTLNLDHHSLYQPSTTVLNYLRSIPGFKGVKEGCAEGDCGACTVVIGSLDSRNSIVYKAVNSCLIFLPWLHGKQLITIEHLAKEQELHPVQKLLIDYYGSQCGFCTPGIVMSLFSLFKSPLPPTRENAVRAMSGNLCRCTGYQPILNAAMDAMKADGKDHFSIAESQTCEFLLSISKSTLEFSGHQQEYFLPSTLEDGLGLLSKHHDALIVSGGTDLAIRQSKKHEHLPKIIDISALEELKTMTEFDDRWEIGSGITMEELLKQEYHSIPMIEQLCEVFASKQIRNIATLGGNIASSSPIGDSLPVLIALEAVIATSSASGSRTIPINDFIVSYRKNTLQNGEIIAKIIIPKPTGTAFHNFYKVSKRRELDISTVSLAATIELDKERKVSKVILAYGGMAEKPVRALKTEALLLGMPWTLESIKEASMLLKTEFKPISDARSGEQARRLIAGNLLIKLFNETVGNGGEHE